MSITSPRPPVAVAPWAEVVPGYGPVTVDLLLTLPDDGYRYEVVEGVLVRRAGSGLDATTIGGLLVIALGSFVYARRLGLVTPSDGVYKFPGAETGLLPDVGFVEAAKVARIADRRKPVPFAPDLAVEVASPSQDADDMAAKAHVSARGYASGVGGVATERSYRRVAFWKPGRSRADAPCRRQTGRRGYDPWLQTSRRRCIRRPACLTPYQSITLGILANNRMFCSYTTTGCLIATPIKSPVSRS